MLQVSRQAVYDRLAPAMRADRVVLEKAPKRQLRLVPPELPGDWRTMALGPDACDVQTAIHVLALRHPAAGYRKITARARRAGYLRNYEKTTRLLKAWGFLRARKKPHPKAQGKPFDITASNQLWQTDMTSIWCSGGRLGLLHGPHRLLRPGLAGVVVHAALQGDRLHAFAGDGLVHRVPVRA